MNEKWYARIHSRTNCKITFQTHMDTSDADGDYPEAVFTFFGDYSTIIISVCFLVGYVSLLVEFCKALRQIAATEGKLATALAQIDFAEKDRKLIAALIRSKNLKGQPLQDLLDATFLRER